jgi:hypothetical protein
MIFYGVSGKKGIAVFSTENKGGWISEYIPDQQNHSIKTIRESTIR